VSTSNPDNDPGAQDRAFIGSKSPDPDGGLYERLRGILNGAVGALRLGSASIYLLNEARNRLYEHVSVSGAGEPGGQQGSSFTFESGSRIGDMMAGSQTSATRDHFASPRDEDAAVSLTVDDKIVGLLAAKGQGGSDRTTPDIESLKQFASQAAFAMEAASAVARWKKEARHERTLFEVSKAIASALDPNQILRMVAQLMAAGVDSGRAAVYVIESDLAQIRRRADFGIDEKTAEQYSAIPFDFSSPAARRLSEGSLLDFTPDAEDQFLRDLSASIGGTPGSVVPLTSKGRTIALAAVALPPGASQFSQDEVELLTAIAAQAAVSIENATLYDAQNHAVTELAALYAVSQALAATPDLNDRLQVVAESIMAVSGVSRCGVFLIEGGQARGHIILGANPDEAARFGQLCLGLSERETAMMLAIKEGRPTIIDRAAGTADSYMAASWRVRRMLAVPLIYEGRTVGLAAADEPGQKATFSPSALKVAAAIGEQAALAIQTARLFEQIRQHAAELEVLWEVAQALGSEMDTDDILDKLLEQVTRLPNIVTASVFVPHSDGTLVVARPDGRRERFRRISSLREASDVACAPVLQQTAPAIVDAGPDGPAILSLPLRHAGHTRGLLNVMAPRTHEFTTSESRVLGSLASVVGALLARAHLYERERRIAETFQRSFLPDVPDQVDGYDIAHQYAAALDEARVGGDFYDVFRVPDGRMALVIGDVSGKGLNAAVHTAMAKYLLRAHIHENASPARVLARVNDALCFYVPESMFITLFYAVLDTSQGLMYYANAGHEPPVVWSSRAGRFRSLACTGMALGFVQGAEFVEESLTLEPEDVLVMYTDGVTEARNAGGFLDISGLRDAARGVVGESAARVAEAIETRAREHAGGRLTDDIALLVVKRRG